MSDDPSSSADPRASEPRCDGAEREAELPEALRAVLALPPPAPWRHRARSAQRQLAPELAYGRHHGPPSSRARRAAVLMLLYPVGREWRIPLTRRSDRLPAHPGQVSLPGGILGSGESITEGALREWEEEMGSPANELDVLGRLTSVYVFGTNFVVTPVVAAAPRRPQLAPNPDEVARVIELPIDQLRAPPSLEHPIRRGLLEFCKPCWPLDGEQIWGATLQMLAELGAAIDHVRSRQ